MTRLVRTHPSPRTTTAVVTGVLVLGSLLPPLSVLSTGSVPDLTPLALPASGGFEMGVDKLLHALSYALLAGVVAAWQGRRGVVLVGIVLAVAALGAGIEVAQTAIPGRTGTVGDAVANLVGAAAGVAGWWLTVGRRSDSRSPPN